VVGRVLKGMSFFPYPSSLSCLKNLFVNVILIFFRMSNAHTYNCNVLSVPNIHLYIICTIAPTYFEFMPVFFFCTSSPHLLASFPPLCRLSSSEFVRRRTDFLIVLSPGARLALASQRLVRPRMRGNTIPRRKTTTLT